MFLRELRRIGAPRRKNPGSLFNRDRPRTGNATLEYSVLRNTGSEPRQGTIVIGGRVFKILQLGPGANMADPTSIQFGFYGTGPSPAEAFSRTRRQLDL